jgi:hypothetical protein
MPPHVESMVCLVDYRSATLKTSPSVSNARHFLNIVQNHYVERLGRAIVVNLPFLLNFFFKAISPFLDPVTRDKVRHFVSLLFHSESLSHFSARTFPVTFAIKCYGDVTRLRVAAGLRMIL